MQNKKGISIIVVLLIILILGFIIFNNAERKTDSTQTAAVDSTYEDRQSAQEQTEEPKWYYGVDVSHWNGNFVKDIDKLDSLTFGICKATEGTTYVDPDFSNNWNALEQKGLVRGAYHFYVSSEDPIQQAKHFYQVLGKTNDSLQMTFIVDIESGSISAGKTKNTIQQELLTCLKHIESLTKKTPMIYTSYYFANEYLVDSIFANYPLWLAEYSNGKAAKIPETWEEKGYTIWQKSDHHDINSHAVDYDVYHGDLSDLY